MKELPELPKKDLPELPEKEKLIFRIEPKGPLPTFPDIKKQDMDALVKEVQS